MRFALLGTCEAHGPAGQVRITARRERALLTLLLLSAPRPIRSDELVERVWGTEQLKAPMATLQMAIKRLREKLPDVVQTTERESSYFVRVAPEALDVNVFERLCERARTEQHAQRAATLREALALWQGHHLADLPYEACLEDDDRRLTALRLDALEARIDADLQLGRFADVLPELDGLVRAHPERERLRTSLMLALFQAGRQREANAAYNDWRLRLAEDGLIPSPALIELHGRMLRQDPTLVPAPTNGDGGPDRYALVLRALHTARLVPVLGPLAQAAGDPTAPLDRAAVAQRLADAFGYPPGRPVTLPRVSQFVGITHGIGPLYDELHEIYCADHPPGPVHRAIAALPRVLRELGRPLQTVITTSFDTALERAFADAGEEVDVLSYVALGPDRGKFLHVSPDGSRRVVHEPNVDIGPGDGERTLVLKIHGGAGEPERRDGSFVVSEDDYIDYLAHSELSSLLPVGVTARLSRSHFLFLGYDLGYELDDWSLRVFLRRLWGNERVNWRSWAVAPATDELATRYWSQCGVEAFDHAPDEYVGGLVEQLERELAGEAVA